MSLEDKLAIQELIAQHYYAWDAKDADAYAKLFAEDAIVEIFAASETSPQSCVESRASIRERAVQDHQGRLATIQTRHHPSAIFFEELTADTACTWTMLLVTHQGATDIAPRLHRSGMAQCQWRKCAEGWRIVHVKRFLL